MFQLDFEEFLIANGFGTDAIAMLRHAYENHQSLSEEHHNHVLDLFRRYLLVGGLPDAVNTYLDTHNIVRVREVQEGIRSLYADDASKYEKEHSKKLLVRRIYEMIPSQMENKKKRIVAQELRAHGHKLFYYDNRKLGEVDYLIDDHVAMSAHPVEVKSGKDYTVHSALNNLLKNPDYNLQSGTVISNEREVYQDGKVTYMPVYFVMFMEADTPQADE